MINVADRRYRLKGLKSSEGAIYTDEGDSVVLKRDRLIEATTDTDTFVLHAKSKVVLDTPLVETPGAIKAKKSIVSVAEVQDKVGAFIKYDA